VSSGHPGLSLARARLSAHVLLPGDKGTLSPAVGIQSASVPGEIEQVQVRLVIQALGEKLIYVATRQTINDEKYNERNSKVQMQHKGLYKVRA
jgi:hypothetical protein